MAPVKAVPRKPKRLGKTKAAAKARKGAKAARAVKESLPKPEPVLDMSPSRYIMKIDRATGAEVKEPIEPHDLLVHAHRDNHPVEIAAQFAASRFIQLTGNEAFVKKGLTAINRLGGLVGEGVGFVTGPD